MSILADSNPIFQPAMRIVVGITTSNPAIVTTSFDHLYISKTIVRIDIPLDFGMQQINQRFGSIVVLSPTTFSIDIDSTLFDPFTIPAAYPANAQSAMAVAFAEDSDTLKAAVQNTLPH